MTLYCNQCGKTETEPYDVGDVCICGGLFVEQYPTHPERLVTARPKPWVRRMDADELIDLLRKQAAEIARADLKEWGISLLMAAEEIERLQLRIADLLSDSAKYEYRE